MDRYDKDDIRFSQLDCERAHEWIVGPGYVDVKWRELLKGEDPTARYCDGRDEHSAAITGVSTSLNQQNNHKLLKFCSQITHTPYNKGSLSQPDAFRTCLDFRFGNQLTDKARHSSQEQLNLLT